MMILQPSRFAAAGGGGAGAHRYWRVQIDTVGDMVSRKCVAASKIEFLLANNTDATASGGTAIGSTQTSGAFSNAYDASSSTLWHASCGTPASEWIGFDFGVGVTKAIVNFAWSARNDDTVLCNSDSIKTGGLEYSDDGSTWTRAFSIMPQYTWTQGERRVIPAMPAAFTESGGHRYWRILMTTHSTDGVFDGLSRLRWFYGASIELSTMGTNAAASSIQAGSADSVVNTTNSTTGLLQYGSGTATQWISKDFGVGYAPAITSFTIGPNKDAAGRTWAAFDLQYSDDNSSWTTLGSNHVAATWAAATPQTFTA